MQSCSDGYFCFADKSVDPVTSVATIIPGGYGAINAVPNNPIGYLNAAAGAPPG